MDSLSIYKPYAYNILSFWLQKQVLQAAKEYSEDMKPESASGEADKKKEKYLYIHVSSKWLKRRIKNSRWANWQIP